MQIESCRRQDATRGAPGRTTRNKKPLVTSALLLGTRFATFGTKGIATNGAIGPLLAWRDTLDHRSRRSFPHPKAPLKQQTSRQYFPRHNKVR